MKVASAKEIGSLVRSRRTSLGLSQAETAQMCNVGTRFFSELENGKPTLQLDKVLECLALLGINVHCVNREDDK